MLYTFPRITPSLSLCAVAVLLPCICIYIHTYIHVYMHVCMCTALWVACAHKHEGAAAELMEATKLAGALDLQVPHEAGQGGCVV